MMPPDFWQHTFPRGRQTLRILDAQQCPVEIAYGEAGRGRPLFLLHGLGSWSYNWRYSVQPLAQQFRVICVDAKGYGFSQTLSPPEVVGHQVNELAQIIRALAEPPVYIAGESLGALTALALVQAYPELVERLVVINVPIFPDQLPSWGMRLLSYLPLPLVQLVDQQQLARGFAPLVRAIAHLLRQEVVFDPAQITDEEIYWLTYPYLYHSGPLTQFTVDLQLAAREIERSQRQQPNWITQIQQNLPRVTCPTLILWSDCDRWFPLESGNKLSDLLPNAEFQLIPNCGHVASSGNPKAVNTAILKFLDCLV
jgi:pimeloyl-ACP methyl ester carboxylesterase